MLHSTLLYYVMLYYIMLYSVAYVTMLYRIVSYHIVYYHSMLWVVEPCLGRTWHAFFGPLLGGSRDFITTYNLKNEPASKAPDFREDPESRTPNCGL